MRTVTACLVGEFSASLANERMADELLLSLGTNVISLGRKMPIVHPGRDDAGPKRAFILQTRDATKLTMTTFPASSRSELLGGDHGSGMVFEIMH
jgi:hypothetical protein